MFKINFETPHITYRNAHGGKVVGVTTALGILNKPALIPWAYRQGLDGLALYGSRDKAANIGTIVHARIMAYYQGEEFDNSNIAPDAWEASNYSLVSFFEWAKHRNVQPVIIEKPLVSEKYQYGGTPDILGNMDDELTLLDFKTGSGLYEEHFIQLAAYLQLFKELEYEVQKIIILNIPKSRDDTFTLKSISAGEYTMELRFRKFIKLVEIYNIDQELKNMGKGNEKN